MNSYPYFQSPPDPEPAVTRERAHVERRDGRLPRMNAMYERIEDKDHCLSVYWQRGADRFATAHDSLRDALTEAPEDACPVHAVEFCDDRRLRDVTSAFQDELAANRASETADADSWKEHERGTRRMRVA